MKRTLSAFAVALAFGLVGSAQAAMASTPLLTATQGQPQKSSILRSSSTFISLSSTTSTRRPSKRRSAGVMGVPRGGVST